MCHENQHQFNHCHGGPHRHMNRCHGSSPHQPVRHEGCCRSSGGFNRKFYSKEEQVVKLEKYLQDLQLEAKAVEERIKELKGEA